MSSCEADGTECQGILWVYLVIQLSDRSLILLKQENYKKTEGTAKKIFPIRTSFLGAQSNPTAIVAMHMLGTLGNAVELIFLWPQGSEQHQLLECRASTFVGRFLRIRGIYSIRLQHAVIDIMCFWTFFNNSLCLFVSLVFVVFCMILF